MEPFDGKSITIEKSIGEVRTVKSNAAALSDCRTTTDADVCAASRRSTRIKPGARESQLAHRAVCAVKFEPLPSPLLTASTPIKSTVSITASFYLSYQVLALVDDEFILLNII